MSLFNINQLEQYARLRLAHRFANVAQESARIDESLRCFSYFNVHKTYDIFLSHSYKDRKAVVGLVQYLKDVYGYEVYVDWIENPELDRTHVTKDTAQTIKSRMKNCKCLFFVTSENAPNSKWMPWELGLMDGIRDKVAICPLSHEVNKNVYNGQEYLGIYPYVTEDGKNKSLWINKENKSIQLDDWMGEELFSI